MEAQASKKNGQDGQDGQDGWEEEIAMVEDQLTESIIGAAYRVHKALGAGFLERVYENALRIELEKVGLQVRQQEPIKVYYDGHVIWQLLC